MKSEPQSVMIDGHKIGKVEVGGLQFHPVGETPEGRKYGPVTVSVKVKISPRVKMLFWWWKVQLIFKSIFRR